MTWYGLKFFRKLFKMILIENRSQTSQSKLCSSLVLNGESKNLDWLGWSLTATTVITRSLMKDEIEAEGGLQEEECIS